MLKKTLGAKIMNTTYKSGDNIRCTEDIVSLDNRVIIKKGEIVTCLGISNINVEGEEYISIYLSPEVGTIITKKSRFEYVETPSQQGGERCLCSL